MKVEIIKKHLFLNNCFPAILLSSGEIRIMIKSSEYWDREVFVKNFRMGLPYSETQYKEIIALFDYDYSDQLMDNVREVIHRFRSMYQGANPSSLKMSPLTMHKLFEQFERMSNSAIVRSNVNDNMFMGIPILTEDYLPEGNIYTVK